LTIDDSTIDAINRNFMVATIS